MSILFDLAWNESIRAGVTSTDFNMETQSATLAGYINPLILSNVDAAKEILGGCVANEKGGLNRTMPLAHPEYGWLFASAARSKGLSFFAKRAANLGVTDTIAEAPPISNFAFYGLYEYTIGFTGRPYVLISDAQIETRDYDPLYKEDGTVYSAFNVPVEWIRFTDYEIQPAAEFITAQQGQFSFSRVDTNAPDGSTVPGQLRMLIKKSTIKFRWYQVPLRFFESGNSFIDQAIGRVNQLDWYGWKAGTLLLLSASYKRYTPPNPPVMAWWADGNTTKKGSYVSNDKLVDIEFTFSHFDPRTLDTGELPPTLANPNHIPHGHNLLPWLVGGNYNFYYAHGGTPTGESPLYKSFPFQLMFCDPDVDGIIV